MDGVDAKLTKKRSVSAEKLTTVGIITVRPASSNPSICSNAILASSDLLYLGEDMQEIKKSCKPRYVLYEGITFASPSHRIFVKVYKLQFSERLEDLLNVTLRKVEVE